MIGSDEGVLESLIIHRLVEPTTFQSKVASAAGWLVLVFIMRMRTHCWRKWREKVVTQNKLSLCVKTRNPKFILNLVSFVFILGLNLKHQKGQLRPGRWGDKVRIRIGTENTGVEFYWKMER